jgi:hypothetical protein
MHKKSLAIAFALFVGSTAYVSAQQPAPKCPSLDIAGPTDVIAGEPGKVSIIIDGGDPSVEATYNWTVSAGTIESGQGTTTITIDTKDAGVENITATVDVGGFDRECSTSESWTFTLLPKEEGEPEPEPTKPPSH